MMPELLISHILPDLLHSHQKISSRQIVYWCDPLLEQGGVTLTFSSFLATLGCTAHVKIVQTIVAWAHKPSASIGLPLPGLE